MNFKSIIKYPILGALTVLPLTLTAQSVELLGIFPSGENAQMKARVDLQGKLLKKAEVISYRMSDGQNSTISSYELIDNRYINASMNYYPAQEYAYRMKLSLTDPATSQESILLSPCFNASLQEPFMWLGDYEWTSSSSGWAGHPAQVDKGVETSLPVKVNGTTFFKNISTHAPGHLEYAFEDTFDRFVTRIGVQDDRPAGDVRYKFMINDALALTHDMYALSNPNRGDRSCFEDVELDMAEVTKLRMDLEVLDGNNAADHAHFTMARLYMPAESAPVKLPQQINFTTPEGLVPASQQRLSLQASSTSGGQIHYRIIGGNDIATLENGNELVFMHGKKGEVIVEATQYGNEQYACTIATLHLQTNLVPVFEMLAIHPINANQTDGFFYLDTKHRAIASLSLSTYKDVYELTALDKIDLTSYLADATGSNPQIVRIPWTDAQVTRFSLRYADSDDEVNITPYAENGRYFDFVSDMNSYRVGTGYGSVTIDRPFSGSGMINLAGQKYAKGFGIHADGWMQVTITPGMYDRFCADAGKQNGQPYKLEAVLKVDGTTVDRSGAISSSQKATWNYQINDTTEIVRIELLTGDGSNANDHGAIGAPRFYYPEAAPRREQALTWTNRIAIRHSKPFRMPLNAKATSELKPVYTVVYGSEYATIEGDSVLNVHRVPGNDSIIVEAFQPGNLEWAPAKATTCKLEIFKSRIVKRDESIVLEEGEDLEELTIYADSRSAGQVRVKSGLVQVKKMVLKYTFEAGWWSYISFPSAVNIEEISNLKELGLSLNGMDGKNPYALLRYDSKARSEGWNANPWVLQTHPNVKGREGYLMDLASANMREDIEVTFTFDNVTLDFEETFRMLDMSLDMRHLEPGTQHTVYISPENVKGNTLKVILDFQPEDIDQMPINHKRALRDARVTYTPNRAGIRITLPDETPAKVLIYDKDMTTLKKAVRYVAPMMINISDLEAGSYAAIISYGNAVEVKNFTK